MAVTMVVSKGIKKEYTGLTADQRPSDDDVYRIGSGSTYMELDGLKRIFMYDANNINPITNDNWWEV